MTTNQQERGLSLEELKGDRNPIVNLIPRKIKIEEAKRFASLHKNPILGLVAYDKGETVPDDVWMEIWNYIWDNLDNDSGVTPHIELNRFETVSGHTEDFEVNYDLDGIVAWDRQGLIYWTPEGILDAFNLTGAELLAHPESGDVQTAKEWAEEFYANLSEPGFFPEDFQSLVDEEIDLDFSFKGSEIAGEVRIYNDGKVILENYLAFAGADMADTPEEAKEYLREEYREGAAWIKKEADNIDYLTDDQKKEIVNDFLDTLSFYLQATKLASMTPDGFLVNGTNIDDILNPEKVFRLLCRYQTRLSS